MALRVSSNQIVNLLIVGAAAAVFSPVEQIVDH